MPYDYPADLGRFARQRWRELEHAPSPPCTLRAGALPEQPALERLLAVAYQASLLEEEGRPVRFRLFLGDPAALPPGAGPPEGLHRLRFAAPRPYEEHEIRRLSPAAKYHRALIGVQLNPEGDFEIWGLIQSGPRWLQSARGGRAIASPIPRDAVVVRGVAPGRIAIAVGDLTLAELRGGHIASGEMDVFESRWLRARFADVRAELMVLHEEATRGTRAAPLDPEVTRVVAQQMARRLVAKMRESGHGGTVLIVPEQRIAALLDQSRALRLKYAFVDEEPRRRYRSLMLEAMRELATLGAELDPPPASVGWNVYQTSARPEIAALDEAILELSQLLGALGDVDGAVLLTKRFEVLGFGGEIAGSLPELTSVRHALDLEATAYEIVPLDRTGTRHRSVYRLCAHEKEAIAIVASQDGTLQFVANHDGGPTYWEHAPTTGAEG